MPEDSLKKFKEYKISEYFETPRLDTQIIFDKNYSPSKMSAINRFFEVTAHLNSLAHDKMSELLPNLLVLGYVSAVESYLREVVRNLVIEDFPSRKKCEDKQIPYGAAISYSVEMLPEALLETCSFTSKNNIKETLRNYLGITFQKSEAPELDQILEDFSRVCQIRHCIVHRYGHLGSLNAINLGLNSHGDLLGKPLRLEFSTLQNIFLVFRYLRF